MANPDPMDFDISGNQPEPDRPRAYHVPLPPQLPFETDVHGNPIIEHWTDVNDDYTVRLLDDRSAFEVRELNENDPTGMGRRFEGDWPKMYPMGPPSQQPDYHPILEKFGLKILNAAGFINNLHPLEEIGIGPFGQLHCFDWRNPKFDQNERIHPVFRFDMWPGISQQDYELMYHSLILASAVLDDPMVLCYFHAMRQPVASMDTVIDPDTNLTCRIVDIPATLTPQQQIDTYQAMCDMRIWTCWFIKGPATNDHAILGKTEFLLDANGQTIDAARPNTRQSFIKVDEGYLHHIRQISSIKAAGTQDTHNWFGEVQRMARIPAHKREHIDLGSAHARVITMLACTILHEFTHAFIAAHFDQPLTLPIWQPVEPWVRGDRSNEQGECFENFVWGGLPRGLTIIFPPMSPVFSLRQFQGLPFGAYFDNKWDQWTVHYHNTTFAVMPSVRPEGISQPSHKFPVPQEWFQRLFTDQMWFDQVSRFGLGAIKMPKSQFWDVMHWASDFRGVYGTGEERWNRPDDVGWTRKPPTWV